MNEHNPFIIRGSYVELSEHKTYLELITRICYYEYPNGNGTQLDYGDTDEAHQFALEKAKTLKMMPVQAKYAVNMQGKPTFKGHEATRDATGKLVFGTVSIGVHEDVWIAEDDVTAEDGTAHRLPCLFARQRIWKRYGNYIAAVKRLYAEGKLYNSWEMDVYEYLYKDGIKRAINYEFLGDALLGYEYASPAYGQGAETLSMATLQERENSELMVAQALAQDVESLERNEVKTQVQNEKNRKRETAETVTEQEDFTVEVLDAEKAGSEVTEPDVGLPTENEANKDASEGKDGVKSPDDRDEGTQATEGEADQKDESPKSETSSLTSEDIYRLLRDAYHAAGKEGYPVWIFPEDRVAWFHHWESLDTVFTQVAYTIEGDKVTLGEMCDVQIALPIRELNHAFSEAKNQAEELQSEVAALREIKAKYDAEQAEKAEMRHKTDVAQLLSYVRQSGYFTEDEIAAPELSEMIENVKTNEVKAMIADRAIASKTAREPQTEVSALLPKMDLDVAVRDREATWRRFIAD